MPHLEHVSVEGFKKIEELELSPGQFNVVTGRNNSGKTSFLEGMSLGCDPDSITKFGKTVKNIINSSSSESIISTSSSSDHLQASISHPNDEDFISHIYNAYRSELYGSWDSLGTGEIHEDCAKNIIEDYLREIIRDELSTIDEEEICDEICIISTSDRDYPYVYFGEEVASFYFRVRDQIEELVEEECEDDKFDRIHTGDGFVSIHSTRIRASEFISTRGQPTAHCSAKTIDISRLLRDIGEEDSRDMIKEDDIGDFLRDKQILDNLKSFSLDHLVFDPEDEEKYSVPFDQMGEGFKAIVGILWELLDDDLPEVVFLEEPDTHMHPGYVRELVYFLIDLAREEDIQLFVTTHNNDFLNDLFVDNLTDEEVEFLEDEFRLIQMQDGGADVMDYREAEHTLEELVLDLRGV